MVADGQETRGANALANIVLIYDLYISVSAPEGLNNKQELKVCSIVK